jgi:hypothetical protein
VTAGIAQQFLDDDGDAVDFLAGGTGAAPDFQIYASRPVPFRGSGVDDIGQDFVFEQFKGTGIPEKQRFVGGDGIDDLFFQHLAGVRLGLVVKLAVGFAAFLVKQLPEPGFQQVGFGCIDADAGYVVYVIGEDFDFFRSDFNHIFT